MAFPICRKPLGVGAIRVNMAAHTLPRNDWQMNLTGNELPAHKASPGTSPSRAGWILAVLILGAIVANVNTSISNVALPSIGRALEASDLQLTAITDAYQFGIAATVLYLGALGDRYGRKGLLILGASLCVPFSLLSAFAPNATVLIAAQVAVGVACGMLYPTTLSLITSLWSGPPMTRAIAMWTGIGTGTSILGPILGGWMLGSLWWGSVFLITVPLALVVLVSAIFILPKKAGESTTPVDNRGGMLSVLMIASFVAGIVALPGGLTIPVVALFVASLVSGILFFRWERSAPNPIFDLKYAAVPTFWVAFTAGLIGFGALVGAMFIGQQFTQNVLGESPLTAVLLTLGLAVGLFPASILAGRQIIARGTREPFALGLIAMALGLLVILLVWTSKSPLWHVVLAYFLVGIGVGYASTSATRSMSMSLPISKAGMSSASADLTKDLGGAVFQAVLGSFLAIAYAVAMGRALSSESIGLSSAQVAQTESSFEDAQAVVSSLSGTSASDLLTTAQDAFTAGKDLSVGVALVCVFVGLALVLIKYPKVEKEREIFGEIQSQNAQPANEVK
jgi:DHA2 family multidrug resistance protein-like MFS transporter